MDCIFCKIVEGQMPTDIVYEDEHVIGFYDLNPQAPIHVLFVPKEHVRRFSELADAEVLVALQKAVKIYAEREGLEERGYRLVLNTGQEGGQTVDHLHIHFLAGRFLQWPPG